MRNTLYSLTLLLVLALLGSCTKSLDAPLPVAVKGIRDTAANIRNTLRNGSFSLFYQAVVRANLDSSYSFYTVFAPSDSAMTAAGLTSSVINSLSLDSLYKLIGYHIYPGLYPDSVLKNDTLTVQLNSLVVTTGQAIDYFGQLAAATMNLHLYVSQRDVLYVNGLPANKGEAPLEASNGWVYPVNKVLEPPTRSVWSILTSRPELSMYIEASWLIDSMNTAFNFPEDPDSVLFETLPFIPIQNYGEPTTTSLVTLLAPTNDAFARAGFNTADDLRQYINGSIPTTRYVSLPAYPYQATLYNYNAMDSVLKLHYLNNPGQSIAFYQDLLYSPARNDGWMNTNPFYRQAYRSLTQAYPNTVPVYSQFSNNGGTLSVQWNPTVPAVSLPFSPAGVFMGANGVVYEVDQLFYPHN
ncbi:MAG TPA: fasciclin domain-containing protein [Dinghuibacter sp.]|uniref:fasciclin domain-containing protein n=1 Tax=Dinghuibacter sp. TaxID=2024697 RepID=UPI002D189FB1|nr:fasciclin domain-containing protein [Dinghuibacter sp.]HTJ14266.1 fasciclin domain-containing protein [Dinghuibacter sp.]